MNLRLALALVVFAVDAWALARLQESPMPRRTRLLWAAAIVALPGLGAWLWWRWQRARAAVSTSASPDPPSEPTH